MKKTFTINISGNIFHIDEDAYEKLQMYLHKLSQHFGGTEEGREILQDIEARIAELLNEKLNDGKDVVILEWVDEIIERMGTPEDIAEGDEDEDTQRKSSSNTKRRMYRDPDRRVIAGICGGMGAYFNIDPVILRIVLFVLIWPTGGAAILIYLILWIAVPKARTTSERLEMRGEDATVSNIEKSIKEEVKEVKASYQRFKSSDTYEKGKEGMSRFGELVYNIFKVLLRVVVVLIGAFLIITGFVGLLTFISSIAIGHSILGSAPFISGLGPNFEMTGFFTHFVSQGSLIVSLIAIGFLVGIPLLLMLFVGTKMLFRYKTNNKVIGLAAVGVWIVALFTLIIVSVGQVDNFSRKTSITINNKIECNQCETLVLDISESHFDNYTDYEIDLDDMKLIKVDGEEVLLGEPRLDIEKSSGDQFAIVIKKKSRGKDTEDAQDNINSIEYQFNQNDSIVMFEPYFTLEENAQWRDQEVEITVKVPVGKTVYLTEDLINIVHDIDNIDNVWDGDMGGKYWEMTFDGLKEKKNSID